MNKQVAKMINEQINKEFYSGYLYLDFSNFFMGKGLTGLAHWYRVQAQEERDHAMLFFDFLHYVNEEVNLEPIAKPHAAYHSCLDVLKAGLAHEEYVTASINDIYEVALKEKDYHSVQFLEWFIREQGEEEANAHELIQKMELLGSEHRGLYMLDRELASRAYSPPSLTIG